MKKIVSMNALDNSRFYQTAGFYQEESVTFDGGYFEIYINQTKDISNEVKIFQERSALAVDYLNYYFNPNAKVSLICKDLVIDDLVFGANNETGDFEFFKDCYQVIFSPAKSNVNVLSHCSSIIYGIDDVKLKWYVDQTNLFDSVDDLRGILAPYKYDSDALSNLIRSDDCPHPYYFDKWNGIIKLIDYYQTRYFLASNNEIKILPFVNYSKPLLDICFHQGEGGGSHFPLFLNNMNHNYFFVNFAVDYVLEAIKNQLKTIIVVIPYSFLMSFNGEYLIQTFQYIRELIIPKSESEVKLSIEYEDDIGDPVPLKTVDGLLTQLKVCRFGYSNKLVEDLRNALNKPEEFNIGEPIHKNSNSSSFKNKYSSEIEAFQLSHLSNDDGPYHRDLSILKWRAIVVSCSLKGCEGNIRAQSNGEGRSAISNNILDLPTSDLTQRC
ncbi:MAG: hypothetical protein VXX85_02400, partial [Candidatus Margulisiibacteriota bacterium]|nr:hypothetical protein [Candidatus Margulisiibacteriota bacterium]